MVTVDPPVILSPFSEATARLKVRLAEDAWNTREPERVALAYTADSQWRNRRDASINDCPIAPSEPRIALP